MPKIYPVCFWLLGELVMLSRPISYSAACTVFSFVPTRVCTDSYDYKCCSLYISPGLGWCQSTSDYTAKNILSHGHTQLILHGWHFEGCSCRSRK